MGLEEKLTKDAFKKIERIVKESKDDKGNKRYDLEPVKDAQGNVLGYDSNAIATTIAQEAMEKVPAFLRSSDLMKEAVDRIKSDLLTHIDKDGNGIVNRDEVNDYKNQHFPKKPAGEQQSR